MTNEIVRAITGDGLVKAAAITGRDIVERARNIHRLLPMGTAALGRALLGASLMGDMLKEDNASLTLQIKGGGPLGTILAVSDHRGNVRGYVQDPQVELMEQRPGKLDVGRAVGTDGTLTVIKDIGLKEPYVGSPTTRASTRPSTGASSAGRARLSPAARTSTRWCSSAWWPRPRPRAFPTSWRPSPP